MSYRPVTIYHGDMRHFEGYEPGDPVAPVFTYVATMPERVATEDGAREAERAFHMFNADLDMLKGQDLVIAMQYRANRLRSLSVGDLVAVQHRLYACRPVGFTRLLMRPDALTIAPSEFLDSVWAREAERFEREGTL